jgi:hypothetical protein
MARTFRTQINGLNPSYARRTARDGKVRNYAWKAFAQALGARWHNSQKQVARRIIEAELADFCSWEQVESDLQREQTAEFDRLWAEHLYEERYGYRPEEDDGFDWWEDKQAELAWEREDRQTCQMYADLFDEALDRDWWSLYQRVTA